MRISWEADRASAFICFILFTSVPSFVAFLSATAQQDPLRSAGIGFLVGVFFWGLFAVQDLRVYFKNS